MAVKYNFSDYILPSVFKVGQFYARTSFYYKLCNQYIFFNSIPQLINKLLNKVRNRTKLKSEISAGDSELNLNSKIFERFEVEISGSRSAFEIDGSRNLFDGSRKYKNKSNSTFQSFSPTEVYEHAFHCSLHFFSIQS